jgi:hypothetical protein
MSDISGENAKTDINVDIGEKHKIYFTNDPFTIRYTIAVLNCLCNNNSKLLNNENINKQNKQNKPNINI